MTQRQEARRDPLEELAGADPHRRIAAGVPSRRSRGGICGAERDRQDLRAEVVGWKIAATSAAGEKHIGVDGPLAGPLLANRVLKDDSIVPLDGNIMMVAEAEFAFKFARALPKRATPYTQAEVLDAVGSLHPAIEVPDSRYNDFAHSRRAPTDRGHRMRRLVRPRTADRRRLAFARSRRTRRHRVSQR